MQNNSLLDEISADIKTNEKRLIDAWVVYKGEKWYPFLIKDRATGKVGIEVNYSGKWGPNTEVGRQKLDLQTFFSGIAQRTFPAKSTVRCKRVGDLSGDARDLQQLQMSERLHNLVKGMRSQANAPMGAEYPGDMRPSKALTGFLEEKSPIDALGQMQFMSDTEQLSNTERDAVVKVRYGQGSFRSALLEISGDICWMSGITGTDFLIASHIQPWSHCERNPEARCSSDNGLLLSSLWDAAFDAGLIGFDESWKVILSGQLHESVIRALGLTEEKYLPMQYRNERRAQFLTYHRVVVFKGMRAPLT